MKPFCDTGGFFFLIKMALMLSKARIKLINQLKQKKYREQNKLFIVEGSKNTLDFLSSQFTVLEVFATDEWIESNKALIDSSLTTVTSRKDLKRISALTNPSDVVAIFNLPPKKSAQKLKSDVFSLVLDDIHDPGNMGTIIRTADWFGIVDIYCSENTVDIFNPKVVQATMGSLSRVNVSYTNISELLLNKPDKLPIFGALLQGKSITELGPQNSGAIIIGSEAHGISKDLIPLIDNKITIPLMNNDANNHPESLNASVACAIICYALKISN